MKNYLLLLLLITFSVGNVNAQNKQEKAIGFCSVTSNFSYSNSDCDTVNFTANPSSNSNTNIAGYLWNFGDGQTSTSQNPTHSYSSDGNYTVTLTIIGFDTISGDCCNASSSQTININCGTNCGITVNGVTELNLLGDNNVAFLAQTQINSGWNITSSTFVVTRNNGSSSTHSGTINNNGFPQIIIPVDCTNFNNRVVKVEVTVYANNSFGVNCSDTKIKNFFPGVCGTGNLDFSRVSPNPVKDILNIDIQDNSFVTNSKIEAALYNLNGVLKKKTLIRSKQTSSIDVNQMKSGIYILKLFSNDKLIESKKIIITN